MFHCPKSLVLNLNEWSQWIQRRFERFRLATSLEAKLSESRVNTLIYSMGDQADDIFLSYELSAEQAKDYNTMRKKFEDHFVVKKNTIFERVKFNLRGQCEGESVGNFITDLYCLCDHCNFGTLKEELIKDRIVVGLHDRKLSEKLQLDTQLTLEKVISLA